MLAPRRLQSRGFAKTPERIRLRDTDREPQRVSRKASFSGGTTGKPIEKTEHKSDTSREAMAHKDKLAQLGCMVCRRLHGPHTPGPVELHHLRKDGWGKGDYRTLMPLCHEHHQGDTGVHGLGTKGFPARYGFDQEDLLADALALIGKEST